MNITFFSSVSTKEKVFAQIPEFRNHNTRYFKLDERDKLLFQAKDTELLFIDAMGVFNKEMIDSMPNLKLIMSEGVGYQGVDVEYASEKGIPVCNNKGVNDTAVSEVALFLMLGCLRNFSKGVDEIYAGRQIEFKKASFGKSRELGRCTVGLLGFGDIARKTAEYCNALSAKVVYTNRTRYKELEKEYNVEYLSLDELLAQSDIVSLHLAVTPQTVNTVDSKFISKMNFENGEVGEQTNFTYHQNENLLWAEYSGGDILKGSLIGTVLCNGELDFVYHHMNQNMQIKTGKCHSVPTVQENGKIELSEQWQWTSGDYSKGESMLVEV